MQQHNYEWGLEKNDANYTALTPIEFISRSAELYPHHTAIIHGNFRQTWKDTFDRCRRLASAFKSMVLKKEILLQ